MAKKKQAKKVTAEVKTRVEKMIPEVEATVEKVEAEAKKVEEKVEAEAKKVVENVVPEVKEEAKEVVEKIVPEAKKTVEKVKKAATKKEIKTTLYVEYYGKQVQEKDMIASVKKAWTKSGKKVGDIKTMALYVKPEENSVYYVINGDSAGRVEF